MAEIYIGAMYTILAIRSILLGKNDRLGIFHVITAVMAAVIIMSFLKNMMLFKDICIFAILFAGCCYTSLKCSDNTFYIIAVMVTLAIVFGFIYYKMNQCQTLDVPAELFRIKIFILKTLHFIFIFSILFLGLESITVFSITAAVITMIFINGIRYYIFYDRKNIVLLGAVLETAAVACMVIIMPWYSAGNIVAFQIENTMHGYINGFLYALLLSLLEIPFNPIWSFEKNLKG